jgi:archaellum biogenesis ATPase FlaH
MMLMNVSGGIAPGEMMIFSGGRRTGKSTLNQYYGTLFNH